MADENEVVDTEEVVETNDPIPQPADEATPPKKEESDELFSDDPPEDKKPEGDLPARPDNIPEKFWNAETGELRLDDLMKSQEHWRSQYQKLMNDESGVPEDVTGYLTTHLNEEGDFVFPVGEEGTFETIPKDDPLITNHLEASLELGLTPKQSDAYLAKMVKGIHEMGQVQEINKATEETKLGDNGRERFAGAKLFIENLNMPKERIVELKSFALRTAEGVQMLEAIMAESGQLSIPMGTASETTGRAEMETRYDELLSDPGALDDNPRLRAEFEGIEKKLYPTDNRG